MSPPILQVGGLALAAGDIVALLGGNGAGKTSLFETILGFRPSTRPVHLFGRDVTRWPVERRVLAGVGYVPEGRRYRTLGTDGFGRSDTRAALRAYFGVDAASIAQAARAALTGG